MSDTTGQREKKLFRYLMVLVIALFCLPRSWTDRIDHYCSVLLSPLSGPSRNMSLSVTSALDHQGPGVSRQEFEQLYQAYQQSQARCVNLAEELTTLRDDVSLLAGLRQDYGLSRAILITADVVGGDSKGRGLLTLNQGSLRRVNTGKAVVGMSVWQEDPDYYQMCVVGQIRQSGPWTSQLQLLSDPSFRMAVEVIPGTQRDDTWRVGGVLCGDDKDGIIVTMIRGDVPIEPGDIVVAQASSDFLPVPIIVGKVRQCQWDDKSPVMWRVVVDPMVDLERLSRVVVIDTNRGQ